jgi:hypothetical protein
MIRRSAYPRSPLSALPAIPVVALRPAQTYRLGAMILESRPSYGPYCHALPILFGEIRRKSFIEDV